MSLVATCVSKDTRLHRCKVGLMYMCDIGMESGGCDVMRVWVVWRKVEGLRHF